MKIKTVKREEESWSWGDVIVNENDGLIGLIILADDGKNCVVNISPESEYQCDVTEAFDLTDGCYGYYVTITDLQKSFTSKGWRKADATLTVKANI